MRPLSGHCRHPVLRKRRSLRRDLGQQNSQPDPGSRTEVVQYAAFMREGHRGGDYFGQQWVGSFCFMAERVSNPGEMAEITPLSGPQSSWPSFEVNPSGLSQRVRDG